LRRLRPADLADLLEDLGRPERQLLISLLDPDAAADALEEMEPEELEKVLRDAPVERAAELLARMEPDEAVDALRDLPDEDRRGILEVIPAPRAAELSRLLGYPEGVAGGIMTTNPDRPAVAGRRAAQPGEPAGPAGGEASTSVAARVSSSTWRLPIRVPVARSIAVAASVNDPRAASATASAAARGSAYRPAGSAPHRPGTG
jgi:hypothetical protein